MAVASACCALLQKREDMGGGQDDGRRRATCSSATALSGAWCKMNRRCDAPLLFMNSALISEEEENEGRE